MHTKFIALILSGFCPFWSILYFAVAYDVKFVDDDLKWWNNASESHTNGYKLRYILELIEKWKTLKYFEFDVGRFILDNLTHIIQLISS
jgi:nitrate reductase gamma subunit